jgi:hypothetical protein
MSTAIYCRNCGRALTEEEKAAPDTIYCAACAPAAQPASGPQAASGPPPPAYTPVAGYPPPHAQTAAAGSGISPGLAFLLGLIPGVGAIYNGQYAKGLIHVVVFGLLLSINGMEGRGDLEPLFVLMVPTWIFYMAFEAYHTAKRRLAGQTVDEFSSLIPLRRGGVGFPVAPVLLVAVGLLFLLHNLEILRIGQLLRYWPVFLIALGAYMLYVRLGGDTSGQGSINAREAHHEQ